MIDKIDTIIDNNFDKEIVEMQQVLRIPTVFRNENVADGYPFGKNLADCLDLFLEMAKDKGFTVKNIDNMVGYAEIGDGDELIGILGHLDVVPEGDESKWISPPYDANIVDGKLYARGVLDNKGAMIACMHALKALQEAGVKLNKRFRLILGLDEETSFKCVKRYLETEEVPYFSFSPDAQFPLVHAEKGIIQFGIKRTFKPMGIEPLKLLGITGGDKINVVPDVAKAYFLGDTAKIQFAIEDMDRKDISFSYVDEYLEVMAEGKSVHAMQPEVGENAILKLVDVVSKLDYAPLDLKYWLEDFYRAFKYETNGETLGIACSDDISGDLTIAPTVLWYKGTELIVHFDMRYPVTMSEAEGAELAKKVAHRLGAMYKELKHKAPLNMPKDMPEIKLMLKAYEEVTGDNGGAISIGGGTYCRAFPNAVSFGPMFPNDEATIHQVNEYATLENVKKMTSIYARAIYNLVDLK